MHKEFQKLSNIPISSEDVREVVSENMMNIQ